MEREIDTVYCSVCGKPYVPGEAIRAEWAEGWLVVTHQRCIDSGASLINACEKPPSGPDLGAAASKA